MQLSTDALTNVPHLDAVHLQGRTFLILLLCPRPSSRHPSMGRVEAIMPSRRQGAIEETGRQRQQGQGCRCAQEYMDLTCRVEREALYSLCRARTPRVSCSRRVCGLCGWRSGWRGWVRARRGMFVPCQPRPSYIYFFLHCAEGLHAVAPWEYGIGRGAIRYS